jgi:serine/threonine protein kinase
MMAQMISPSTLKYTPDEALQWCLDIASALSYLHNRPRLIIHRDLKLENILLHRMDNGGLTAIVADFGLGAVCSLLPVRCTLGMAQSTHCTTMIVVQYLNPQRTRCRSGYHATLGDLQAEVKSVSM